MTDNPNIPSLLEQGEVFDGNTIFDNIFVLNKLDYDFKKSGTIEIDNLRRENDAALEALNGA